MTKDINTIDVNKFKKIGGAPIGNLANYIKEYINLYKDEKIKLFIGTDSQNTRRSRKTTYATVICLYREGKGAHIIYNKLIRSDIRDRYTRLWLEVTYSMQIVKYLEEQNIYMLKNVCEIHVDVNTDKKHDSNKLYKQAKGYVTGEGYEFHAKPLSPAASYAADLVCKSKKNIHK